MKAYREFRYARKKKGHANYIASLRIAKGYDRADLDAYPHPGSEKSSSERASEASEAGAASTSVGRSVGRSDDSGGRGEICLWCNWRIIPEAATQDAGRVCA